MLYRKKIIPDTHKTDVYPLHSIRYIGIILYNIIYLYSFICVYQYINIYVYNIR